MNERIMLVDDSSFMRAVLKKILKGEGYERFVEATDGADAVHTYERERPDIVLMDIVMPNKSGLDALREIKQLDPGARIIMVTAIGQDVVKEEAEQAGAKGFIVKPFDAAEVRSVVQGALGGGPA